MVMKFGKKVVYFELILYLNRLQLLCNRAPLIIFAKEWIFTYAKENIDCRR